MIIESYDVNLLYFCASQRRIVTDLGDSPGGGRTARWRRRPRSRFHC